MFKNRFHSLAVLTLICLFAACGGGEAPPAASTDEAPAAEPAKKAAPDLSAAGSVSGKVNFEGTAPRPARIRMSADPACEHKHTGPTYSEQVIVNENGTLKNAFVWVKSGLEQYTFDPPSEPVVLDQDGCVYQPRVLGVQAKQPISILNSDPSTHNIHPLPEQNREWNISQSPGQDLARSFPRQEVMIPVKCNIHPWMKAYIGVVAHPYFAVTGDDGTFELKNLPPGDYTIEVWHEKYGTQQQQITVGPNQDLEIEFSYKG